MNPGMLFMLIVFVEIVIGTFFSTRSDRVFAYAVRIWSIWFPELLHFRSTRGARMCWNGEFEGRMTRWLVRSGVFGAIFGPVCIGILGYFSIDARLMMLLPVLFLPVTTFLMLATNRREIRANLRRFLRFEGTVLCPSCNYIVTGNESGICPECGTTVEAGA